jgi:hypothetical protein
MPVSAVMGRAEAIALLYANDAWEDKDYSDEYVEEEGSISQTENDHY